jgi:hypothetical protein
MSGTDIHSQDAPLSTSAPTSAPAPGPALGSDMGPGPWEEFCEKLKGAGELIQAETSPEDTLDRSEGYRYLSRLTRLALEKFVEHGDPEAPQFYQLSHATAKIGQDNPDSFYQNAKISGDCEYRISGTRGSVGYLGLGTYFGDYGKPGRSGCGGYLEGSELEVNTDGSLEIFVSCKEKTGNWLPMEPDASMLIVRQNFLDRSSEEPAQLRIERIDATGPPAHLNPETFTQNLSSAGDYVAATARLFADWTKGLSNTPNSLQPLDPKVTGGAHGDPHMLFHMGYWELQDDEALVIEGTPPECAYWNFQLSNRWMESLDYRNHRIHTNKHTTDYESDGSFRLIVSHRDPGLPNWLDTAGHERGTMALRWAKASGNPTPSARVVQLRDLSAAPS